MKKKYKTLFPMVCHLCIHKVWTCLMLSWQARIKKIMQKDEDVGKIALATPILICIHVNIICSFHIAYFLDLWSEMFGVVPKQFVGQDNRDNAVKECPSHEHNPLVCTYHGCDQGLMKLTPPQEAMHHKWDHVWFFERLGRESARHWTREGWKEGSSKVFTD